MVRGPGEVSRDDGAQELEGLDPLYTDTVDVEGSWVCAVPPEVDDDFLCLCGIQCQVVR